MKKLLIHGAMAAFLGLAVASLSAQTQTTTSTSTSYIETSKIVGKKVKSSDGQEVGTIKDVVLDRNTGCMAYTVMSTGAAGGRARGGKMVAVPWAVYSPTSNLNELTVTVDRERIYSAPVFDYAHIDEYSRPDYITNVYSYYGVSPGAGVGVGVSGSTTTGATTATGAATTPGAATGAAAGAAASASPGASESPAATASPRTKASPTPHATPARSPHETPTGRPHATASPHRGRETASPPSRGGASATPVTRQPGRRGVTGSLPESQRSPSAGARVSPSAKQTAGGAQHRGRGKRETGTPQERPQE